MKKWFSAILAVLILTTTLTSCSGDSENETEKGKNTSEASTEAADITPSDSADNSDKEETEKKDTVTAFLTTKISYADNEDDYIEYCYDEQHRLTGKIYSTGETVSYGYEFDANGHIISFLEQGGINGIMHKYNEYGDIIEYLVDYGDMKTITYTDYEYDSEGRITHKSVYTERFDADGNSQGEIYIRQTETYEYNVNGDILKETIEYNGDISTKAYTYDKNGLLIKVVNDQKTATYDNSYEITYKYNENGILIEETYTSADHSNITEYSYDDEGRITEITTSSGNSTVYNYDEEGNYTDSYGYIYDKYGNTLYNGYLCYEYMPVEVSPAQAKAIDYYNLLIGLEHQR